MKEDRKEGKNTGIKKGKERKVGSEKKRCKMSLKELEEMKVSRQTIEIKRRWQE